jgi:hypothetical protein
MSASVWGFTVASWPLLSQSRDIAGGILDLVQTSAEMLHSRLRPASSHAGKVMYVFRLADITVLPEHWLIWWHLSSLYQRLCGIVCLGDHCPPWEGHAGHLCFWPHASATKSGSGSLQDMLERYCNLISLSSYLSTEVLRPGSANKFQEFIASMPEIESAMDRLLRAFPLLSLELAEHSCVTSLSTARTSSTLEVPLCFFRLQ